MARLLMLSLAGAALALAAVPAAAHHSHAMFDDSKEVVLSGTVKKFEWTNPHSWVYVMVTDDKGKEVEYALEMGSPSGLARRGWRPKTVVPGDKVTVKFMPLRNGDAGGSLKTITLPDGKTL